jgi:RND family efflux transporter MFP subunit
VKSAIRSSLFMLCALAAGCGHDAPEEVETGSVVPVTTQAVRVGTIRAKVQATGIVTPAVGADLVVIPPETARIAEMPKAEGDQVRRGDLLVRFEVPSLNADAAGKRAELTKAEARLRNARAAQARAHDLFDRGVAARKEVEDADRELAEAEAALAEAEAARRAAETVARRTTVRATFDGVVAKRSHNPGDLIEATTTDPVLRVVDPRRLEVIASIPTSDVSRIVVGASARLLVTNGDPLALKVLSRPTAVVPGTAAAPVRLAFLEASTFAVGTPVQVEIDAEQHDGVLLVPAEAVVREGGDAAVFVASGGKARRRVIYAGLADDRDVEVRSGLKPGEQVITHGQAGLPDGAAISLSSAKQ